MMSDLIVSKDKYYVSVEITDYYGKKIQQIEILVERGMVPSIGDYIQLFKETYEVDVEIKDIPTMEFRVKDVAPQGIRILRALRIIRDYTYTPITKL
jgi:hypothetical protein